MTRYSRMCNRLDRWFFLHGPQITFGMAVVLLIVLVAHGQGLL